jgi:uncharacterized protein
MLSAAKRTLWLLALALLVSTAAAEEPEIPSPRGFVNDFAGAIDAATRVQLEGLIGELQRKTGAEIAVVTVESTKPLSPFDYAMRIAETWKPGEKGKDNGVVFLVAVRDRELFILTGYGVEGELPDGRVGEIRDRLVVPRFKRGDLTGGIRAGTEEMARIIAREHGVTLSAAPAGAAETRARRRPGRGGGALAFLLLLFLLFFLGRPGLWPLLLMGSRRRRGMFGGGFGGGGFGGGGGGFGGFGGGGFGGGGAGGRW